MPTTDHPTRAVIYCRVSTADQSCERQERDLRAYAHRAGYQIIGLYKETASGARLDRAERRKVMALAQQRAIDMILVTELSRWSRSTQDLLNTLQDLDSWRISLHALSGMTFDYGSAYGRMLSTVLAGVAQFERETIGERVRSGLAAARARGKTLGRQTGQRPTSDRLTPKILALRAEGRSYRWIARELQINKNTVMTALQRAQAARES